MVLMKLLVCCSLIVFFGSAQNTINIASFHVYHEHRFGHLLSYYADLRNNLTDGIAIDNVFYKLNVTLFDGHPDATTDDDPSNFAAIENTLTEIDSGVHGHFDAVYLDFHSSDLNKKLISSAPSNMLCLALGLMDDGAMRCDESSQAECDAVGLAPNSRRFNNTFSMLIPGSRDALTAMSILIQKGARRFFLLGGKHAFSNNTNYGIKKYLDSIEGTTYHEHLPMQNTKQYIMSLDEVSSIVQNIKTYDPDVLVNIVGGVENCINITLALKSINYTPKAHFSSTCTWMGPVRQQLGSLSHYWISSAAWSDTFSGDDFEDISKFNIFNNRTSPSDLSKYVKSHFPYVGYSNWVAALWAGMVVIENAAVNCKHPLDAADLIEQVGKIYRPSHWGVLSFDKYGFCNIRNLVVYQVTPSGMTLAAPPLSATGELVYPAPTYDERVFDPKWFGYSSELAIAVLAIACLLVNVVLSVLIAIRRKLRVVMASSFVFCMLMSFGCALVQVSVFVFMIHQTPTTCSLRLWLPSIGYVTLYTCLFLKNFRIYRIFAHATSGSMSVCVIKTADLLLWLVIALVSVIIFNVLWITVGGGIHLKLNVVDELRPVKNHFYCDCDTTFQYVAFAGIYASQIGLVILCYLNRRAPSMFNETQHISIVAFIVMFCTMLALPSTLGNGSLELETVFIFRSMLLLVVSTLCVCVLFIPKLFVMHDASSVTTTCTSSYNNSNLDINSTLGF